MRAVASSSSSSSLAPPILRPRAPAPPSASLRAEASALPGMPQLLDDLHHRPRTFRSLPLDHAPLLQRAVPPLPCVIQKQQPSWEPSTRGSRSKKLLLGSKALSGEKEESRQKSEREAQTTATVRRRRCQSCSVEVQQHREDLEEQHHQAALVDEIGESASQLGENENDELTQRVRRAVELANNNHLSRATQALIQPSLAPSSPSTVAQLRSLHPPSSASFSAPSSSSRRSHISHAGGGHSPEHHQAAQKWSSSWSLLLDCGAAVSSLAG